MEVIQKKFVQKVIARSMTGNDAAIRRLEKIGDLMDRGRSLKDIKAVYIMQRRLSRQIDSGRSMIYDKESNTDINDSQLVF